MDPITSSCLSTEIEFRANGRVRSYRVRPATAREGIGILDASRVIRAGEGEEDVEAAFEFVRQTAFGWFPLRLASDLFGRGFPPGKALAFVLSALSVGSPEPKKTKKHQEEAESMARETGWHEIIADYMRAYSQPLSEVMTTPFPAFLGLVSKMERVHAAEMIRMLQVRGIPHIKADRERKQRINALMMLAGIMDDTRVPPDKVPDWMKDPEKRKEWKERKMKEAFRVREMWGQKVGKA